MSRELQNGWICRCTGIGSMAAKSVHSGGASEFKISRKCFLWSISIFFSFSFLNFICGSPLLRITFYLFLRSLTRWRKRTEVWCSPTCLHKWRNWNTSERILRSKTESCFSEIPINVWMKTLISNYFFGYIFRAHAVEMLLDAVDSYPQMAFFEVVVWIILKRRHLIWKSA